jgi:hypothetical protein
VLKQCAQVKLKVFDLYVDLLETRILGSKKGTRPELRRAAKSLLGNKVQGTNLLWGSKTAVTESLRIATLTHCVRPHLGADLAPHSLTAQPGVEGVDEEAVHLEHVPAKEAFLAGIKHQGLQRGCATRLLTIGFIRVVRGKKTLSKKQGSRAIVITWLDAKGVVQRRSPFKAGLQSSWQVKAALRSLSNLQFSLGSVTVNCYIHSYC